MANPFLWLYYALIALMLYGLWAFFPKLASNHLHAKEVILYQIIGIMIAGLSILLTNREKLHFNYPGLFYSILGGAAGIVGTFFFIKSLAIGKTSVVVTLTALYPIITICLALIFLKETISLKNALGIVFALAAMYLFVS